MNRQELMDKLSKQLAVATQITETSPVPAVIELVAQLLPALPVVTEVAVAAEKPSWHSKFEEYAKAHTPETEEEDDDEPVGGEIERFNPSEIDIVDYAAIFKFSAGTGDMCHNLDRIADTIRFISMMLNKGNVESVNVHIEANIKGVE